MDSNREVREMRRAVAELSTTRYRSVYRRRITGERRDEETVKRGSEGGRWKSACEGNSLAAYLTHAGICAGGAG